MLKLLQKLSPSRKPTRAMYNDVIDRLNLLSNIKAVGGGLSITIGNDGVTLRGAGKPPNLKWFKLTVVGSNPMTGRENTCIADPPDGVFSEVVNAEDTFIYRYPQFTDQTSYEVDDYVLCMFSGNCWVSLYNTPIQLFECV